MVKEDGERYTVAVDFDGVLHSYTSPWVSASFIPDPPVPGAIEWLFRTIQKFYIAITSTRNHQRGGVRAMRRWLREPVAEGGGGCGPEGFRILCRKCHPQETGKLRRRLNASRRPQLPLRLDRAAEIAP